jgi:exodeoxyribonuclease VII small subunit
LRDDRKRFCEVGLTVRRDLAKANCLLMIDRLLSPSADPGNVPVKFEDLLARLEEIVSDMENADLPLEKLLASYEEGMQLVKKCGDRLADAEQKVEILSRTLASSQEKAAAATEAGTAENSPTSVPKDEIRLF